MEMKRKEVIEQLEKTLTKHQNKTTEKEFVERLMIALKALTSDEGRDPGGWVMYSHGECERDGIYAPVDDDGKIDFIESSPFREGDVFPKGQWIQIDYVYE